jgi:hypothetical protein
MIRSLIYSLTFHSVMILLTILSLPFMLREPIDLPPIVSVELNSNFRQNQYSLRPKQEKLLKKLKKKRRKISFRTSSSSR